MPALKNEKGDVSASIYFPDRIILDDVEAVRNRPVRREYLTDKAKEILTARSSGLTAFFFSLRMIRTKGNLHGR